MPIDKNEESLIMNSCLPTIMVVFALGLVFTGLLGEVPSDITIALDWATLFILIFAVLLYGKAGIQAIKD